MSTPSTVPARRHADHQQRPTDADGRSLAELAEAFGVLTRELADGSLTTTARALPGLARRLFPHVHSVELVEQREGHLHAHGVPDPTTQAVLRIGEETGSAPVLDALHSNDIVVCQDVPSDDRWPEWARRIGTETTIRSALCYRLYLTRSHRAAFTLYSEWPQAFDQDDVALGSILASYCSLVCLSELVLGEPVDGARSAEVFREIGFAFALLTGQGLDPAAAHRSLSGAGRRLGTTLGDGRGAGEDPGGH